MLSKIIEFSLKNRVIILALTALVIVWGIFVIRDTPIDAFPDLSENQVLVSADWMGRGPQEIQDQVTYPLETAMRGLPSVKEVRSASSFGMSLITVIFEDRVDPYFARQVVNEKVQQAIPRLPQGVQPALGPVSTPMGQVFMYTVESDRHNLADLRTVEDFVIKPQLSAVPGVAEVASVGGYVLQYQINLDPQLLQSYRVTLNQVFNAIAANNSNVGAKVVEQNGQEFIIRGLGLVESIDDIKDIVITQNNYVPVYVRDVAGVTAGPDFRRGVLTKSGYEAAGGIVIQRMGENTLNVIDQVKAKMAEIQATLPEGVKIVPFYDQTDLVKKAVNTLNRALIEEFILVSLIVIAFLGNVRSSLIVTSAIPIGILLALIAMREIGLSANLMSLGGIAIGIGVMTDAAIVMVENIYRHLAGDGGRRGVVEVTLEAAQEVASPIFFSIVIIIVTFLPVFTMTGTEGKLYTPMAWAKTFAMSGSLLLAFTLVPVLCTLLLKGKIREKDTWVVAKLHQCYAPALKTALKYNKATIVIAVVVMIAGFSLLPLLGTAFMPALDEGSFLVMPTMLPSVSLTEAVEAAKTMDRVIMEIPEIDLSVGKVGRAESAMDPAPVSMIETIVTLKPKDEWRPGMTKERIEQEMMAKLAGIPGLNLAFTQPIAGRLAMLTTGVRTELGIKLYGEDLQVLQQKAFEIEAALGSVPGVSDLLAERVFGAPYLEIGIDRAKAARYGLSIADVEDAIELAVGGRTATTTIEGRRRFDVLVRYNRENRESIDAMQNILLPVAASVAEVQTPSGGAGMSGMGGGGSMPAGPAGSAYVPLGEVAHFQVVDGPSMISSENGVYRMIIQMNTRGRDVVGFVNEANQVLREKVELPAGYSLKWAGQYENQQRAKDRLGVVVPAVIALTFFLLYLTFRSASDAFLILMNIPFSLVGGIVAMYATGTYLTVAAAVGFIALFGIAVQNGVIMVTYIQHLRAHRTLEQAILEGAFTRLRPVMITALVASLGLFPLIFATGAGAEVQRPMAIVVVGGLVTSTILTLIVLPCIYLVWNRWRDGRKPPAPGSTQATDVTT
ncbi:efflux RND transporter permease subunit|uniref:Cu(I)/Ag(I) efflux system membrane protein CusA/SilA n=1 Tax=Dendrosporobacter quercicolus TaxID=146817 RepID=A0A1G9XDK4_9FIRM|nr:CusA/CzcA family heavy metal efflux RND transporter [Dendrosporobacter quercicolus]NSL49694.1 efflux RND transporter permease subunit [Dendrosporobacter quercicolus DSM 1736]SDM94840.1 Cu(I)/Ag(I) efflux system membrane protein CusA/SilA [Dendrosporobacter quercicolus]